MKKKILSVLLAGALASFMLTACGGAPAAPAADGGAPALEATTEEAAAPAADVASEGEHELSVYAWDANFNIPALQAAEAAYKAVDPDFTLNIITQSGSIQELMVNEQVPAYKEFKRVGSMTDAYLAVQEGKADAAIVARSSAQLYVENNPSCGLVVLDYRFFLPEEYDGTRIGMKKGETDLRDYVNACIDELLESGQYSEWYDYYTEYGRSLGITNG